MDFLSSTDLIIAAVTFGAAIVSGLAGFAFALIASGPFFYLLPPVEASALVLSSSLVAQIAAQLRLRQMPDWKRLAPFALGGIFGLPLGLAILTIVPAGPFRLSLGIFLVGYSIISLCLGEPRQLMWADRKADVIVGFLSGILGGIAGISGALLTIWVSFRGWTAQQQRAVYAPYFVMNQLIALPLLLPFVDLRHFLHAFLLGAPLIVIGAMIGVSMFRATTASQFRLIVLGLLAFSGVSLVARQLFG